MMGRQILSNWLSDRFCFEDQVPAKHLLHSFDRILQLDYIRATLASYYSHMGRPSIDPELMLRMMLVGYAYGIRSERRLCEEVHLNLAYRWFCRLGLADRVPNHSTFSKNRYRRFQQSGIYRMLFEQIVQQCQEAGLVSGEGFAVDGTLIEADVNYARHVSSAKELHDAAKVEAVSRPVQAYLESLQACAPEADKPPHRSKELSKSDHIAGRTLRQHEVVISIASKQP
jgi:transposase